MPLPLRNLPKPVRRRTLSRNAYFGDLHLDTSYSMDAFAFGTRTTPEDSFKFARVSPSNTSANSGSGLCHSTFSP